MNNPSFNNIFPSAPTGRETKRVAPCYRVALNYRSALENYDRKNYWFFHRLGHAQPFHRYSWRDHRALPDRQTAPYGFTNPTWTTAYYSGALFYHGFFDLGAFS